MRESDYDQSEIANSPGKDGTIHADEVWPSSDGDAARAFRRQGLLLDFTRSFLGGEQPRKGLEAAFPSILQETGADFAFLYELHEMDPNALMLTVSFGVGDTLRRNFGRIGISDPLSGRVARSRAPVIFGAGAEELERYSVFGATAFSAFPLIAQERLFGVLAFVSQTQANFSSDDIAFFAEFADLCSSAFERARVFDKLSDSETRYRIALSAGRIGSFETNFATGVRTWSDEGMKLFGVDVEGGLGIVGGEIDEFAAALHPEDRHHVATQQQRADEKDTVSAEYRVVHADGTQFWLSGHDHVLARTLDGKAHRLISVMADITERKQSEEHIRFLLREMSHRAKNLLQVIQAIASRTVTSAHTKEDFVARFVQRLQGLAASHDMLVDRNWEGAALSALVRRQLAPFVDHESPRLVASGADVLVTAPAAQAIGLALHELATNAAKYGSLSNTNGVVNVSIAPMEKGLKLEWTERDGPEALTPTKKGFGLIMIEKMVAISVGGDVTIEFAPTGLKWTLTIPEENIVRENKAL